MPVKGESNIYLQTSVGLEDQIQVRKCTLKSIAPCSDLRIMGIQPRGKLFLSLCPSILHQRGEPRGEPHLCKDSLPTFPVSPAPSRKNAKPQPRLPEGRARSTRTNPLSMPPTCSESLCHGANTNTNLLLQPAADYSERYSMGPFFL